ncbi:MAG TPA: hypothetical protein VEH30_15835 [Terriglobales bacterium]|nr:hypothetical protein [Terriglobales bacterium]
MRWITLWLLLVLGVSIATVFSQNTASQNQPAPSSSTQTKASAKPDNAPTAAEIAAAKASHKVWVNLDSGIYHKGGRWYGRTKNGKFMTLDEAKKAGYKPAKRD